MNAKVYVVNEVFYSLQGEGHLAGTAVVFVRFAGCNLTCRRETDGFDCDTEFTSGRPMTGEGLVAEVKALAPSPVGVVFTGGEPLLQLDEGLVEDFVGAGFTDLRVETNGTHEMSQALRSSLWVTCSPKTAEHTLRVGDVNELRYVRRHGMAIPKPSLYSSHLFISPAFGPRGVDGADLEWCIDLVKKNPKWRLSVQQHKGWGVR